MTGHAQPGYERQVARARSLRAEGRPAEALSAYDAALALRPGEAALFHARGYVLLDLARYAEALESFDRAVQLSPRTPRFHYGRALALMALERPAEALPELEIATAGEPGYAPAHQWRGHALLRLGLADQAAEAYQAALALQPDGPPADAAYARALMAAGRPDEALAYADKVLARWPSSDPDHLARAFALLSLRRFREGWEAYEHRRLEPLPGMADRLTRRPDLGDIRGRRVLAVAEQGVGDVIMFASILPDLVAEAGHVGFVCDNRLARLFAHSFPEVDFPLTRNVIPFSEYDVAIGVGSLGRLYRNELSDFPGRPYLRPTPAARQRWARRLGPKTARLRIGLSWRGGLQTSGALARSIPLQQLEPLLTLPDCEFVSLQYGEVRAEVEAAKATLARPITLFAPNEIDDFDELAALIPELDAVVSVQTAVVHLAGALGAPCLALLPHAPEWRYGASGETMPWYGSVRLLRQGRRGEWKPVLDEARAHVASGMARSEGFP